MLEYYANKLESLADVCSRLSRDFSEMRTMATAIDEAETLREARLPRPPWSHPLRSGGTPSPFPLSVWDLAEIGSSSSSNGHFDCHSEATSTCPKHWGISAFDAHLLPHMFEPPMPSSLNPNLTSASPLIAMNAQRILPSHHRRQNNLKTSVTFAG